VKIIVHDYAGYAPPIELSRVLARRGHEVIHAYFAGDRGPKGDLARVPGDSPSLSFVAVQISRPYDKASYVQRRFNDVAYGRAMAGLIGREKPDLVISGNTPTEAQGAIIAACRECSSAFVFWVQDFYSIAVSMLLRRKSWALGAAIGMYYRFLERRQLRRSDAIVVITDQFRELAGSWAGSAQKVFTVENWGDLKSVTPGQKVNEWSRKNGVAETFNFVYAGTLGLKHNPQLLIELARRMKGKAQVIVVSHGIGVSRLVDAKSKENLDNLIVLPLMPPSEFSMALAAADVAVAVIEPEAGIFSVPSKVLSYFCARRAVLLAAPTENLAAKLVAQEAAGLVVDPCDISAFLTAASRLRSDAELRSNAARRGRDYAERTFDVERVADRFESIFSKAMTARPTALRGFRKTVRAPRRAF